MLLQILNMGIYCYTIKADGAGRRNQVLDATASRLCHTEVDRKASSMPPPCAVLICLEHVASRHAVQAPNPSSTQRPPLSPLWHPAPPQVSTEEKHIQTCLPCPYYTVRIQTSVVCIKVQPWTVVCCAAPRKAKHSKEQNKPPRNSPMSETVVQWFVSSSQFPMADPDA